MSSEILRALWNKWYKPMSAMYSNKEEITKGYESNLEKSSRETGYTWKGGHPRSSEISNNWFSIGSQNSMLASTHLWYCVWTEPNHLTSLNLPPCLYVKNLK